MFSVARHNLKTLKLLFYYYSIAGCLGGFAVVAIAGMFYLLGAQDIPGEAIFRLFLIISPIILFSIVSIWVKLIQPRIQVLREDWEREYQRYLNQKYKG